jgi:phosphoadenosine phosphosulfate reductase
MLISKIEANLPTLTDAQLASGGGQIVQLEGDADWREIQDQIRDAVQVDVHFDSFKDGRGFTLATQLRTRAGFTGRLRAMGDLIPDQAQFLTRVGFDTISPDHDGLENDWKKALKRFSVVYQPANDGPAPASAERSARGDDLTLLNARYRASDAMSVLRDAIEHTWTGKIAVLSSFGAEAAITLHMVSRIDPTIPVLFLDTGRHFAQTEQYQRQLTEQLGLTGVRLLQPNAAQAAEQDPDGMLWSRDPDACCALRKVRPLDGVLGDYDALITGRKQVHGGTRISLPVVERINSRIRINPLAAWSKHEIQAYFKQFNLPQHPLTDMGYTSVGCWTCTAPASDEHAARSGRWLGQDKTECGIHAPVQR